LKEDADHLIDVENRFAWWENDRTSDCGNLYMEHDDWESSEVV